ncbi:hypothetical protein ACFFKH_10515 [Micromonospora marina]|uniref:Uncharacterized protein n=1 Tax=Micromonospora marina TaxID=307120 RepID=A0A1C5A8F7_9ACTN|nr:hypothetical protein [Micromonospora marina]SCF41490.1 hypothetical protein GA0070215_12564 [Micromonospora marina]
MTRVLRQRYTKLLRWYPAADRTDRGVEIVDTYMDLATAGQRWPHLADVADLAAGGLRQRLRARNAVGLADALPLAGTIALVAGTVLATMGLILTEVFPDPGQYDVGAPMLGPFHTLGALAWITWLLVLPAGAAGYGRWAVAIATAVTIGVAVAVAVVPSTELTSLHQPNLFVLVPQLALGLVALAVPRRHSYRVTAVITAFVLATGVATVLIGPRYDVRYEAILGALLFLALIVTGAVLTARRDRRAWWPAILLLGPVLLLGPRFGLAAVQALPAWDSRRGAVAWAAMSLLVAVASLLIAVSWQARRGRHRDGLA